MYSYQSIQLNKLKENLNEKIDLEFEELNEKIDNIEELIEKKINENTKKVKDLYSLQNKMNEVNKMNSQFVINQINQYDEEIGDNDENRDQIFNSVESSLNKNPNKKTSTCFIKLSQTNTNPKENFYMSPDKSYDSKYSSNYNKHAESNNELNLDKNNKSLNNHETSKIQDSSDLRKFSCKSESDSDSESESSEITKSLVTSDTENTSKSSKSSTNLLDFKKKNKIENYESDIILEINSNCIKTNTKLENSPKADNIKKSLSEFSNIVKNNSTNKLNSDDNDSSDCDINKFLQNDSSNTFENNSNPGENFIFDTDTPLLFPNKFINKLNILSVDKPIKIIDITK
jgi:hypothetical protein